MNAMKVFSEMIKFFKNRLIEECKNKMFGMVEPDIKFVITVPAIWTDPAKQFMREAAQNVILIYNFTVFQAIYGVLNSF